MEAAHSRNGIRHRAQGEIKMTATKLPELPVAVTTIGPCMFGGEPSVVTPVYTADQLRAYGDEREAYGRATAHAEVATPCAWQQETPYGIGYTFTEAFVAHLDKMMADSPGPCRDGWRLVPVEATEAMVNAFHAAAGLHGYHAAVESGLRSAIATATTPPADPFGADFIRSIEP